MRSSDKTHKTENKSFEPSSQQGAAGQQQQAARNNGEFSLLTKIGKERENEFDVSDASFFMKRTLTVDKVAKLG